jgi:hypothetical protein
MKITKKQLKRIIKEEFEALQEEKEFIRRVDAEAAERSSGEYRRGRMFNPQRGTGQRPRGEGAARAGRPSPMAGDPDRIFAKLSLEVKAALKARDYERLGELALTPRDHDEKRTAVITHWIRLVSSAANALSLAAGDDPDARAILDHVMNSSNAPVIWKELRGAAQRMRLTGSGDAPGGGDEDQGPGLDR